MKKLILLIPIMVTMLLNQTDLRAQCNVGDLNAQNLSISPSKLYSCGQVTVTAEWLQQAQVDYDANFHEATLIVSLPNEFKGTTGTLSVTATDGHIYWNTSAITVRDNEIQVPLQGVIPSGEGLTIILSGMDMYTDEPILTNTLYVSQSISNAISDCHPNNDEQFLTSIVRRADGPLVKDIQASCNESELGMDLSAQQGDGAIESYSWTGPHGFSSRAEDPRFKVEDKDKKNYTGTYKVTVTDANGCTAESSIDLDESNCEALNQEDIDVIVTPGKNIVKFGWGFLGGLNSRFFSLERSEDGQNYTNIGVVQGRGTSSEIIEYDFTDYSPLSGKSYYRLKQVDSEGVLKYSPVKEIFIDDNSDLKIFPNPVSPGSEINIQGEKIRSVKIYNMLGQLVFEQVYQQPLTKAAISTSNLSQGIYIAKVNDINDKKLVIK